MKKAKNSSQTIFYTLDTHGSTLACNMRTRHVQEVKNCGIVRHRVMEVLTVISPENRGGRGGGRNNEQGVTARQYIRYVV